MSFWSFIKVSYKFLPELVSLIKFLSAKIEEGIEEAKLRNALKEFNIAMNKAVATKNTSDLENIFRGKL